jgi:hypothetical protein
MKTIAIALCACVLLLAPASSRAGDGHGFTLQVNQVRLYMTHYALFEEPDPVVPPGLYLDAATGLPTDELSLTPPCETTAFTHDRGHTFVAASAGPVKSLPYFVEPPGFPPLPAPDAVVAAISAALGGQVPAAVIAANTTPLLIALGHFEPTPGPLAADLRGDRLAVTRDLEFQVKVRVGFRFQPPAGLVVPPVGVLTGWLTHGLVDQLIGQPPGANANDLVVYNWRSTMTLSTEDSYLRSTASEPPPVADAFPAGLDAVRFTGQRVDRRGGYTLVGHGVHVPFDAPPELALFLFGVPVLTDVEFAVEESGVLTPRDGDDE